MSSPSASRLSKSRRYRALRKRTHSLPLNFENGSEWVISAVEAKPIEATATEPITPDSLIQ